MTAAYVWEFLITLVTTTPFVVLASLVGVEIGWWIGSWW